jgi:putative sterol carrier protein
MAEMTLPELMAAMPTAFVPERAKGVDAVFQFSATGEGAGDWAVAIRDGTCTVTPGIADKPTVTFRVDGKDLLGMLTGKLNGMSLFMQGRLRVQGDLGLASRFASFFSQ